jgi:hypothetical protein
MAQEHLWKARCTAGRAAIVIAESHERESARDMTRGLLMGFLEADSKYSGWDDTIKFVREVAAASRVPAEVTTPKLQIVRG